MPAYRNEDDLPDRDDPDEADQDPGELYDDIEEVPCPYCGKPVYEHAELCPHCRSYISRQNAPASRLPRWFWIGVILVLVAVATWVMLNS